MNAQRLIRNSEEAKAKVDVEEKIPVSTFTSTLTSSEQQPPIHRLALVSPTAVIGKDVRIAPFVYIGERVHIGAGSIIEPNVTILDECELGARVRIGAGTVIGAEGFGYEDMRQAAVGRRQAGRWTHIPHTGKVIIEDDVEIGANCTIARAKTRVTRIGAGTKIDSLVHIAHNVTIGRNCIIIAQVGIAGSARIGENVILAGQVGIKDHVSVGDNSIVYAKSALYRSIPPDSRYSGNPARPHRENLAALAQIRRIAKPLRTRNSELGTRNDDH